MPTPLQIHLSHGFAPAMRQLADDIDVTGQYFGMGSNAFIVTVPGTR